MANAHIPAKNVVGGNTAPTGVSGTSARIAVGSPYVRMTGRNIGAQFAERYVRTAKGGVSVKFVVYKSS
jgi:hypothetical protein